MGFKVSEDVEVVARGTRGVLEDADGFEEHSNEGDSILVGEEGSESEVNNQNTAVGQHHLAQDKSQVVEQKFAWRRGVLLEVVLAQFSSLQDEIDSHYLG